MLLFIHKQFPLLKMVNFIVIPMEINSIFVILRYIDIVKVLEVRAKKPVIFHIMEVQNDSAKKLFWLSQDAALLRSQLCSNPI